jgi:DNA-binding protein HU-beta
VNKSQLIDALAARYEGNRKQAQHALDSVLDTITREVAKGEKVAITGFGSFEKRVREARWVRNPQTGARIKAKKTAVPKFTAGADLKNVVSGAKKLPKLTLAANSATARKTSPAGRTTASATKAAPAKKATAKKTTARKTTAKKTTAKKTTAKKTTAKKTTARKTTARKAPARKTTTAAKKTTAKKTTARNTPAKKAAASKATAKRTTARKTTARKTSAKKMPAQKTAAQKTATRSPDRSARPDDSWTVTALRSEARRRGLTGYSRRSKAQLVAELRS